MQSIEYARCSKSVEKNKGFKLRSWRLECLNVSLSQQQMHISHMYTMYIVYRDSLIPKCFNRFA